MDTLKSIGKGLLTGLKWVGIGLGILCGAALVAVLVDYLVHSANGEESALAETVNDVAHFLGISDAQLNSAFGAIGRFVGGHMGWDPAAHSKFNDPKEVELDVGVARPGASVAAQVVRGQPATASGDVELTFAYLDVGKWGGTSYGDAGDDWNHKRTFGIVCGRTAVLCEFGPFLPHDDTAVLSSMPDVQRIPLADGNPLKQRHLTGNPDPDEQAEIDLINRFLAVMEPPNPNHPKDKTSKYVHVRRHIRSRTRLPAGAAEPPHDMIHVFLGDMHMPSATGVATDPPVPPPSEEEMRMINANSRAPESPTHYGNPDWHADLGDPSKVTSDQQSQGAGHHEDTTRPLAGGDIQIPPNARDQTRAHGRYIPGTWNVIDWQRYYRDTDAFMDAGYDLKLFIDRCISFKDDNNQPLVRVHQLGDCIDLWIGFHHYLEANTRNEVWFKSGADSQGVTAHDFVDTWTANAFFHCKGSFALRALINYPGPKTFCWGNHDDYYGNYEPSFIRGGTSRVPHYNVPYHYHCEHGHRWDDTNKDGSISGWGFSQLATKWPEIRSMEPGKIPFSDTYGRDGQVLGAAKLYYMSQPDSLMPREMGTSDVQPFCIYVMGHTHVGNLQEIKVKLKYAEDDSSFESTIM